MRHRRRSMFGVVAVGVVAPAFGQGGVVFDFTRQINPANSGNYRETAIAPRCSHAAIAPIS
jgi:hypothetical protein